MRQQSKPSLAQIMAWRQTITWTKVGILSIGPVGLNFVEILMKIKTFPFMKMRLKISFAKLRPFCIGLYVLGGISVRLGYRNHLRSQDAGNIR